jgi:hypothetical protein
MAAQDKILQEAQNIMALQNTDTPLKAGLQKARVFKKNQPSEFFWIFSVFLGFLVFLVLFWFFGVFWFFVVFGFFGVFVFL